MTDDKPTVRCPVCAGPPDRLSTYCDDDSFHGPRQPTVGEPMSIELMMTTDTLLEEIKGGAPQKSVAMTYALAIRSRDKTDWPVVNKAIVDRWSRSGLERIKRLAWSGRAFDGD